MLQAFSIPVFFAFRMPLLAQGYDDTFEMKNKFKGELQYSDYGEYEYPEPILFNYGTGQDYVQNYPYIVNFPEKRGLLKFTHTAGSSAAWSFKYQYSGLREDAHQHLGEVKWTKSFSPKVTHLVNMQVSYDTRGFLAYQPGFGGRWDVGPLTLLQADAQYYWRGEDASAVGGRLGSLNLRFKFRQVLTLSTAFFIEYDFYAVNGKNELDFTSHSISVWLSQFLPTQTALHALFRFYDNTLGIRSYSPSLEIAQYLAWNTVLRIKYRYYWNESGNVSFGEEGVIVPDGLQSQTAGIQLNRQMNPDVELYGKYRFYKSNLGIQMNTYLVGCVYSF